MMAGAATLPTSELKPFFSMDITISAKQVSYNG